MNIYNDSKYTKWYYSIVTRARSRIVPKEGYCERHHIIPRSMGGSNSKKNLVDITAREHFVCHRLLTKMTSGENLRRAWAALRAMVVLDHTDGRQALRVTSRLFERIREEHSLRTKDLMLARWQDPEYRRRMIDGYGGTVARKAAAEKAVTPEVNERKRRSAIGRLHSPETRAKMVVSAMAREAKKRAAHDVLTGGESRT